MRDNKKIYVLVILLMVLFVMTACSSNSKQDQPANLTSVSEPSAVPVQPSGEAALNEKTGQENNESVKKDGQQGGTSVPEQTTQLQLEKKVENNAVLPAKVYVFTNNAGCCEATRKIYSQYRAEVETVESKYGNLVPFTWFDVGIGDVAYQKQLQQYASKLGIRSLPSIAVVDANDKIIIRQTGPLNMAEIDRVFGGLN